MILILSDSIFQGSMDEVIDWLHYKRIEFVRVNGLNVDEVDRLTFDYQKGDAIVLGGQEIFPEKIKVVWFYRWTHPLNYGIADFRNKEVQNMIVNQIASERKIVSDYFFSLFEHATWLTSPKKGILNKLIVLKKAKQIGLKIPNTIVTNNKKDLENFINTEESVITKSLYELFSVTYNEHNYTAFTSPFAQTDVAEVKDKFYPTLFQKRVEKIYEIRSFYLCGKFYSMAILSQLDKQTTEDFRVYNKEIPNRNVPYQLPKDIEKKLDHLMTDLGLLTGSVDLMADEKGDYYFLEVNPVGQYGMTSKPCNYYLEEIMANQLIAYGT